MIMIMKREVHLVIIFNQCNMFDIQIQILVKMIRQKSLWTIKETVKDKQTITRNPSLKHFSTENSHRKHEPEGHLTKRDNQKNKIDKNHLNLSKDKTKSKKHIKQEKSTNKLKSQHLKPSLKQEKASLGCVQMKKQLKLLIAKNTSKNIQKPSQHSQYVKKIQKCSSKNKKTGQESKVKTNASVSQRSVKNSKEDSEKIKKNSPNRTLKMTQPQSLNASKHIQQGQPHKYHFGLKNARHSLESNPIGVQKSQIEQALLIKPKKQQANMKKEEEKSSFLDIFKKYKKSFDIEGLKIQKGLKNHQNSKLKANQSNNTSEVSLINKLKGNTSENLKVNKSETPSVLQQDANLRQIGILNEFNIKESQSLMDESSQEFVKLRINNKMVKKIDIDMPPQKPHRYSTQDKGLINMIKQNQQICFEPHQQTKQAEKIVQFQLYQEQSTVQQQTNEPKSNQSFKDRQKVNFMEAIPSQGQKSAINKFQASKYYVQPIPEFKQKKNTNIEQESPIINKDLDDNSLLGCEITIIQKNVMIDQQDFNF